MREDCFAGSGINRDKTVMFIGHRECYGLSLPEIKDAILPLWDIGYDTFLNGGMGMFDRMCARAVFDLKATRPELRNELVIPYFSFVIDEPGLFDDIIYPEGMERYHFKAAIPARNRYMVDHSSAAICFITHTWGGAAQTYRRAKREGLLVVELFFHRH